MRTFAHKRRIDPAQVRASYTAAMVLDTVGMEVVATVNGGQDVMTRLKSLPTTNQSGVWHARVDDQTAEIITTRIRPLRTRKAGTRIDRGGA